MKAPKPVFIVPFDSLSPGPAFFLPICKGFLAAEALSGAACDSTVRSAGPLSKALHTN